MMTQKKPFASIAVHPSAKPSSDQIKDFAAERGAPTLGGKKTASKAPEKRTTPNRGPVVKLSLEVPASLRPQLKQRAFEQDVTINSIVLNALAKAGFDIDEADLVSDRRKA